MQKKWLTIALINLFIAACLGALMRYAFVEEVTWMNYRHIIHAHSHVAMLGWIYMGLYTFLIYIFLREEKQNALFYNKLFWLTQLSVIGMLIAFPIQGYAGWSIAFSVLHIVFSYIFVYRFWKDLGKQTEQLIYSRLFVKTALLFMLLSTIALWGMGPIMAKGMKGSALYHGAIQFYLHFQFNGWFIFGLLALFFKLLENAQITLPKQTTTFFWLLTSSCLLTYILAVTWSNPLPILFYINSVGVLLQFAALIVFLRIIKSLWGEIKQLSTKWINLLFGIAFISFVLKILIQTAVVIPYIATIGYTIRNYVVGFLHLLLLGLVTSFLVGLGTKYGFLIPQSRSAKIGIFLFLMGWIFTEILLFLQGTMFWGAMGFMPYYYALLFGCSMLLPIGIFFILMSRQTME